LALRSDWTIPIARLVSSRYAEAPTPFRFFYIGNAYRAVRPQRGQMREFMQAGIELVGGDAPDGTAQGIERLGRALDPSGLAPGVIGLGDADLYRQLLSELRVEDEPRAAILDNLAEHDLVGLGAEVAALDIDERANRTLVELPGLRGGSEILDTA